MSLRRSRRFCSDAAVFFFRIAADLFSFTSFSFTGSSRRALPTCCLHVSFAAGPLPPFFFPTFVLWAGSLFSGRDAGAFVAPPFFLLFLFSPEAFRSFFLGFVLRALFCFEKTSFFPSAGPKGRPLFPPPFLVSVFPSPSRTRCASKTALRGGAGFSSPTFNFSSSVSSFFLERATITLFFSATAKALFPPDGSDFGFFFFFLSWDGVLFLRAAFPSNYQPKLLPSLRWRCDPPLRQCKLSVRHVSANGRSKFFHPKKNSPSPLLSSVLRFPARARRLDSRRAVPPFFLFSSQDPPPPPGFFFAAARGSLKDRGSLSQPAGSCAFFFFFLPLDAVAPLWCFFFPKANLRPPSRTGSAGFSRGCFFPRGGWSALTFRKNRSAFFSRATSRPLPFLAEAPPLGELLRVLAFCGGFPFFPRQKSLPPLIPPEGLVLFFFFLSYPPASKGALQISFLAE